MKLLFPIPPLPQAGEGPERSEGGEGSPHCLKGSPTKATSFPMAPSKGASEKTTSHKPPPSPGLASLGHLLPLAGEGVQGQVLLKTQEIKLLKPLKP